MIYILDTDTFTLAYYCKLRVRQRMEYARVTNEVAISVVTRIEVLRGRFDSVLKAVDETELRRACEMLESSEQYLAEFSVLPFENLAIEKFDLLRDEKKLRKIGRPDLLIACIALAHSATLVTRNVKDFASVPGLLRENWAD